MEQSPFKLNRKFLFWTGIWRPRQTFLLYWAFFWISIVFVIIHVITEAVAIYVFRHNLQLLATIICIILTGCSALFKISYCMYEGLQIQNLLQELDSIMDKYPHQKEEESLNITRAATKRSEQVTSRYAWAWTAATVTWMLMPILYGDPTSPYPRPLPLLASFPFDIRVTPYYEIAYAFQVFSSYIAVSVVVAADSLCVSLFINVAGQLKVLNNAFRTIVSRAVQDSDIQRGLGQRLRAPNILSPLQGEKGDDKNTIIQHSSKVMESTLSTVEIPDLVSKTVDDISYRMMTKCVEHHQEILRYTQQMEMLFSPLMFYQCVSSTFIICFVTFLAASSSLEILSLLKCLLYLVVATFQLWLYCTYGDDVTSESLLVGDAVFSTDWIGGSTKFKRSLMMIIAKGRRPLLIKAAHFYTISLETFAALLNASYTYFTILQQVNRKRLQ